MKEADIDRIIAKYHNLPTKPPVEVHHTQVRLHSFRKSRREETESSPLWMTHSLPAETRAGKPIVQ